ncbi:hypothetical protein MLD38_010974 [Melastoma candidum]|nr:hypothetical protein MLD38_010974 [Melastoma candidum]
MQNLLEPKNASQELCDTEIKEPSTSSAKQEEAKFLEAPNDFLDHGNGVAAPYSLDVGSEPTMGSSAEAGIASDSKIVNEQLDDDSLKEGDIVANEQTRPFSTLLTKDADVIFASVPSEEFGSIEDGHIDTVSTEHQSETPDSVSGSLPIENLKEDKNFQTYVVPKDILVIEEPEMLIEGYKDYSVPKLHVAEDLASPDTILQKEDSYVLACEDNSMTEIKVHKELGDVPSSDLPNDKSEPDGDLKELKEDVPIIPEGGDNACKSEKLETETIDQDLSIQDLPVESSISVPHKIKSTEIPSDTGGNNLLRVM